MDLTGRFPYCSSKGNEYILIAYHYDSNAILGLPVANRQAGTLTKAWKKLHETLTTVTAAPNVWILDNETSKQLQSAMTKKAHEFPTCPTTHTQSKCCRTFHPNVQKSLQGRISISRLQFSNQRMGQIIGPSFPYSQLTSGGTCQPQNISSCISIWTI